MRVNMIAPCGMNCAICIGFQREKNKCEGCNGNEQSKPQYCRTCTIVLCEKREVTASGFCYECPSFPCARMKQLDKRYRTKYGMSMLENLAYIKEHGMEAFLAREEEKWQCKHCNAILSVHRKECLNCGEPRIIHSYEI